MSESTFFGVEIPVALNLCLVFLLVVLAGIMAGLILCVFSLDVNRLSALAHGQNAHDAKLARRLLKILDRPHWLLITLLIWNDIALEMMPLMLNMVLNPFVAIFTCVAITLVFSEIIPQAIFIHHAFTLSARLAPFIYLLMWVSSPIAWPIGKLLDIIVGDKEAVFFQRRDLRELIRYQEQLYKRKRHDERSDDRSEPEDGEEDLTKEEIAIMLNVLSLSESTARDMLQAPMSSMYRLHVDAVISEAVVETVFMNGYNFVPVYEDVSDPCNVTCVLMTKSLVLLVFRSEGENIQVKDLPLIPLQRFSGDTLGSEMYVTLQSLSPSIAAITDNSSGSVLGLLTLRNVTELVHQTTFKAEMDPRNQSPMQMIMRSWKIYGRGDGSIDVNRQHSSLHDSFARWSPIPPWDRRDHAGRETQVPQMSNAVRLTSPGRSRSADYAELL